MKKNFRKPFFFFLFCGVIFFCFSQQPLQREFAYDAAGNRTSRSVVRLAGVSTSDTTLADTLTKSSLQPMFLDEIGDITVHVFPNPTNGRITMKISNANDFQSGTMMLYTFDGRFLKHIMVQETETVIDLSNYTSGVYILRLTLNGWHHTWKIIKD